MEKKIKISDWKKKHPSGRQMAQFVIHYDGVNRAGRKRKYSVTKHLPV